MYTLSVCIDHFENCNIDMPINHVHAHSFEKIKHYRKHRVLKTKNSSTN